MDMIKDYNKLAIKEHQCDFCSKNINIGEKYRYKFAHEGYGYNWKTHLSCMEIAEKLGMFESIAMIQGLQTEDFQNGIHYEYDNLIKTDEETSFEHKLLFLKHRYHVDTH